MGGSTKQTQKNVEAPRKRQQSLRAGQIYPSGLINSHILDVSNNSVGDNGRVDCSAVGRLARILVDIARNPAPSADRQHPDN